MSHPLKKLEDAAKSGAKKIGDQTERDLKKIADRTEHDLKKIEGAGAKAARELEDLAKQLASAPFRFAAGEALAFAIHVIETKPPDSYDLRVGPVRLEIHDVRSRIATMKRWRDRPPRSAADIREMIETLAPTRIHLATQLSLPVSDALSVGFRGDWSTADFLDVFDALMRLVRI